MAGVRLTSDEFEVRFMDIEKTYQFKDEKSTDKTS